MRKGRFESVSLSSCAYIASLSGSKALACYSYFCAGPTQLRGLASGAAATANWAANAAVAQTFLLFTSALGGSGTFLIYAAIAAAGVAWVWWCLPETNGALCRLRHPFEASHAHMYALLGNSVVLNVALLGKGVS